MEVDWVPVVSSEATKTAHLLRDHTNTCLTPSQDTLSSIMLEIIHTRHADQPEPPSAVFHLTNPEKTPWSSLILAIQEKYQVEPVDFGEWVAELEGVRNPTTADVATMPALKLLDFLSRACGWIPCCVVC